MTEVFLSLRLHLEGEKLQTDIEKLNFFMQNSWLPSLQTNKLVSEIFLWQSVYSAEESI